MRAWRAPSFWIGIFIALMGVTIGIIITRHGVSIDMDATWYLTYARSMQSGDGLSAPITTWQTSDLRVLITQWPPLYPLMLAIGNNPLVTGRVISVNALGASGLLLYAIGLDVFKRNQGWAFAAAILYLTMRTVLERGFVYSISEVPFVPVCLAILWLMLQYPKNNPIPIIYTLGLAILIAIASMLRYVGVGIGVFVGIVILYWVVRQRLSWWHLVALIPAGIPMIGYMLYLRRVTGTFTGWQTTGDSLNLVDIPDTLLTIYEQLSYPFHFALRFINLESNYWTLVFIVPLVLWVGLRIWQHKSLTLNEDIILPFLYVACYQLVFWLLSVRSEPIYGADERHYLVILPVIIVLILYAIKIAKIELWLLMPIAALWVIAGLAAIPSIQAGQEYNTRYYRENIHDTLLNLANTMPNDTLWHTMHVGYLSLLLDNDTPVRMIGIAAAFETPYQCNELIYPEGYTHAAFLAIDEQINYALSQAEIENGFSAWVTPCGDIIETHFDSGFALILVALDDAVIGNR